MSDGSLLRAIRHNCWANDQLIEFCSRLSPEQLAWTAKGTYGDIHSTLRHIVAAEHGYLFTLTGHRPPIEETGGGRALSPEWVAPLEELRDRARSNREHMETLLAGDFDPARMLERRRPKELTIVSAGVLVAQFIHHGSDHRAHIGTILGAHGVEPPDLDVWSYGSTLGEVTWSELPT